MSKGMYWTCPFCESNLDFGEKCDCLEVKAQQKKLHKMYKRTMNILQGGNFDEREN